MTDQYEGDPNSYPSDYSLADDSEAPSAAVVNVGLEALGDRTAWLRARLPVLFQNEVTATGGVNVTAPEGATFAIIEMCGGGGGGGGGANSQVADIHASGGGGGGGAILVTRVVPVVGGRVYIIFVGTGGAGGAAGFTGSSGGDTQIFDSVDEVTIAHATGALGGSTGKACATPGPNQVTWGLGGSPASIFGATPAMETTLANGADLYRDMTPQRGGNGVTGNNGTYAQRGNASPHYTLGGEPGSVNATSSGSTRGGGAGGGGGAGPYGDGGAGGNGGAPGGAGSGGNGTAGASAPSNSGAGGGGGGAAGGGNTPGGVGGAGGDGASGRVRITWLKRGLV